MKKIRVLTVDDSAFIRVSLKKLIETDDIEICGSARNGEDAIKKIKQLNPDVVTLDVDMPVMNGIECLQEIKKQSLKVPVVMLSSLTTKGA
jgi:two-component system chemotaxis response regulator CheB